MNISTLVLDIVRDNPLLSNQGVADEVQRRVPTAKTSSATVSSIKSNAKKNGDLPEGFFTPKSMEPIIELPEETDEERADRIRRRYSTLERMAERIVEGTLPALIVSGPPGLGKSYTVEKVLERQKDPSEYDVLSGTVSAVGLYIALWNMKDGGVVVLDDCDDVFRDETCLNILKAVLDSSDVRRVSWRKRAHWLEELGIDDSFEFKGQVVFCTNIDFEIAIRKGSAMAPHFEALIDRSLYLSLTMRTDADFIARIQQVAIEERFLVSKGLTEEQAQEIMDFVKENKSRFYGLSIRLVMQIAICFLADPETWQDDVVATKMRTI